jgi:pimeloyl-ACP methyl ester carboxylesterase
MLTKNASHVGAAAKYAIYAVLSDMAYERDAESAFNLPAEWKVVEDLKPEGDTHGMGVRVFEHAEDGKPDEVVVAFRGTEPKDLQDWETNLLPFRRRQMPPAMSVFEAVTKRYEGKGVRFVTTGHSLGGGLALHITFHRADVRAVTFDPSPVTKPGRVWNRKANARVIVWQSKEILAVPRAFIRPSWGDIEKIPFHFSATRTHAIKRHGMHELALGMLGLAMTDMHPLPQGLNALIAANCAPAPAH